MTTRIQDYYYSQINKTSTLHRKYQILVQHYRVTVGDTLAKDV